MEDYSNYIKLDRKSVMYRLQAHEKYKGLSQKAISESIGGIMQLRGALADLDNEEKVNTHLKNKYLAILQKTKKYHNQSPDEIYSSLGKSLKNLEDEVKKNRQQYNTFEHFEQLPADVQSSILELNPKALRYSPVISKTLRHSKPVQYSYYKTFCDLPIDEDEITDYVETHKPDDILFYYNTEQYSNIGHYISTYDGGGMTLYIKKTIQHGVYGLI